MVTLPVRVVAVVLTYYPRLDTLEQVLKAVLSQVDHVLLIDNGSTWYEKELLARVMPDWAARMSVLRLERNEGVASGHNEGIRWAKAHFFSHVLILDQDSLPATHMVARLSNALLVLEARGARVAAVGPRYVDRYTGHCSSFVRFGWLTFMRVPCPTDDPDSVMEVDFLISSGVLIPMAVLEAVGVMDDGLFIDHVDTEWILRARHRGYRTYGACNAFMNHSLGERTIRFWFGRWWTLPAHRPERHYYIFRNSLLLYGRSYMPRRWVMNDLIRLTAMALFYPLFVAPRLVRLRFIARGVAHGLMHRQGALV